MEIVYACWRLKDLCDEYKSFLLEENEAGADKALKKIRELVAEFGETTRRKRMDSAFFAGELDGKIGERNVQYSSR